MKTKTIIKPTTNKPAQVPINMELVMAVLNCIDAVKKVIEIINKK